MIATLLTLSYYIAICLAALIALPMVGPWAAVAVAIAALTARYFFGPLNGKRPAASHGMADGLIAVFAVFANVSVIVLALLQLTNT